jgi:ribonuclease VapC
MDASIIVAILAREDDWRTQSDRVDAQPALLWSAMSRWESVVALRVQRGMSIEEATALLDAFRDDNAITLVPIGDAEASTAIEAYRRFGRRSGSKAQLNMGDCFAYACARTNDARLLYKGNDFSHTDVARA